MNKRPHAPVCFCYKCEAEQFSAARAAKDEADERLARTACSRSSDTPETDAWINEQNDKGYNVWSESIKLARKLERERGELWKMLEQAQNDHRSLWAEASEIRLENALLRRGYLPENVVGRAREISIEGSTKTPEERAELEDGFRCRISSENAGSDATGSTEPKMK